MAAIAAWNYFFSLLLAIETYFLFIQNIFVSELCALWLCLLNWELKVILTFRLELFLKSELPPNDREKKSWNLNLLQATDQTVLKVISLQFFRGGPMQWALSETGGWGPPRGARGPRSQLITDFHYTKFYALHSPELLITIHQEVKWSRAD